MSHQLLLVEANEDDGAILSGVLQDRGYRVDVARSAAEATRLDASYAIALIDLWLPDASGIELAHTLRGRTPDLDIIFLTGQATLHSGIGAVAFGAAAVAGLGGAAAGLGGAAAFGAADAVGAAERLGKAGAADGVDGAARTQKSRD